jgi:hypothetical protein
VNANRQFEETKSELEKTKRRFELYETIILSIAILGTAWSAYQAARFSLDLPIFREKHRHRFE